MTTRWLVCCAVALAVGSPAAAQDLESLVAVALEANPALEAREARVDELEALASAAGAWPDPVLGLEYSNVPVSSFGLSGHPMSGLQVRAQQMLKPPGWSGQQRAVADQRTLAAAFAVDEAESGLRSQVETAYWQLTLARQLRGVTQAHVQRTDELLMAVRARYETGGVGQHAVLRLEVLRDRLADSIDDDNRAEAAWTARLNGLMARESVEITTPAAAEVVAAPKDASGLLQAALESRPRLARLDAERQSREEAASLARLDSLPDPSVWTGYRIRTVQTATDPGVDLVSVGVGVPIPTGSGRRASAARAAHLAGAEAARAAREADLDEVAAEIEVLVADWRRADDKASVYARELIPAAEAALETAFSDYAVDKADFASLFDAEVALLELERARIHAVIDTRIALARARALTGDPTVGGTP